MQIEVSIQWKTFLFDENQLKKLNSLLLEVAHKPSKGKPVVHQFQIEAFTSVRWNAEEE